LVPIDHLGTPVGALDGAGSLVATQRYWPYGAVRSGGVTQTDKLYTGQQAEPGDALGLYNYRARFYSTTLGRFVSGDVIANDGLNRFTYAANNPMRFRDPSGHCVQDGNGRWLECSRSTMVHYFSCAWGGECAAGDMTDAVRQYARGVIQSDAFKFFVGIESLHRGDIWLRLTSTVEIHDAARVVAGKAIVTGRVSISVYINATDRVFLPWADVSFTSGDGPGGGFLEGWMVHHITDPAISPYTVSFGLEAGPQHYGGGDLRNIGDVVKSCVLNPFACSKVRAKTDFSASFDREGALTVKWSFEQLGDLVPGIPTSKVPGLDDLLALREERRTIEEVDRYLR